MCCRCSVGGVEEGRAGGACTSRRATLCTASVLCAGPLAPADGNVPAAAPPSANHPSPTSQKQAQALGEHLHHPTYQLGRNPQHRSRVQTCHVDDGGAVGRRAGSGCEVATHSGGERHHAEATSAERPPLTAAGGARPRGAVNHGVRAPLPAPSSPPSTAVDGARRAAIVPRESLHRVALAATPTRRRQRKT